MDKKQELHLERLVAEFSIRMREKYAAGVEEHAGFLGHLSNGVLLDHAVEEVLDLWAYLWTVREKRHQDTEDAGSVNLHQSIIRRVEEEYTKAYAKFGPLTEDHFRACTLLQEEVGEVARALLEINRAQRNGKNVENEKASAVRELIQVISVAVGMIINLEKEEEDV